MQLTGKCKECFESFLLKNYNKAIIKREAGDWNHGGEIELSTYDIFDEIPCITRNSIIIDFFDSVGMFIQIGHFYKPDGKQAIFEFMISNSFQILLVIKNYENRQDATIRAIESANDVFNNYPLRYVNL